MLRENYSLPERDGEGLALASAYRQTAAAKGLGIRYSGRYGPPRLIQPCHSPARIASVMFGASRHWHKCIAILRKAHHEGLNALVARMCFLQSRHSFRAM